MKALTRSGLKARAPRGMDRSGIGFHYGCHPVRRNKSAFRRVALSRAGRSGYLTEEIAMYPISNYELAKARAADLHRQAQRDALARAARRSRHTRTHRPRHPAPAHPAAAVRRLLAALGARTST
jgi:hypothetical protein